MEKTHGYVLALGRLLLSGLFIWAGYGKLKAPGATMAYFAKAGVPLPSLAVWVAILIELVGGIALLVGFRTRWVAAVLAIWCVLTGFAVHLVVGISSADAAAAYNNMIHFYKNLAMAGGLLFVFVYGAGGVSIDDRFEPARAH
jgi:putative oxidoreductase